MKRFLSTLLASLMIATALTGCGGSDKNDSSTGSTDANGVEVVTLKIAHNYDFVTIPDAVIAAADRVNERYASEGRNMRIEFETDYQRIDWTEYHNNIVFADKNGEGPDIFSLDSDIYGFVKAGMLLDVSDLATDDFVDGVFTPYTIDGKIYGMPFDLPTRVIYFNKKALTEIGWSDEDIAALPQKVAAGEFTWEQFIALCAEVQQKGAAEYGLSHRPGSGSDFLDVLETLGGRYNDGNGNLVFDTQGLTRFFQSIYDNANTTKITPSNLSQLGWPEINAMVGDGRSFAYYGPIYSATYVAQAVNKTPDQFVEDVAFMIFPKSEYTEKAFCTAAPQGMGINAKTKYPEVCKDLLRELATGSADQLAKHGDTIFSLSSVKAANEMDAIKQNPILKEAGYMADYAKAEPTVQGISTFNSELQKQIVQLELGQITPDAAVAAMRTQIELAPDCANAIFE